MVEINSAVNQMDRVTQQNAAMVEVTNAASDLGLRSVAFAEPYCPIHFRYGHQGITLRQVVTAMGGNPHSLPSQHPAQVKSKLVA
ncbi:hypothetical protein GGI64_004064 [Rhizobium leguminosarum]|uniref:Uncharacterized protein n=1 Tax=Rhizobium leguminosarum TaxID=384 RepID=A0A7Z0IZS9_RHILE|nr:hypothetical protein [Rhizobium leguminosarum]